MQVWLVLGNVALITAATITTSLVVVYAFMTRWEKSQVGQQFMLTKVCLASVLDYGSIVLLFGNRVQAYNMFSPGRVFMYGAIAAVMLRWLIILLRAQRDVRRKRHPVWDAPEAPPPVRSES